VKLLSKPDLKGAKSTIFFLGPYLCFAALICLIVIFLTPIQNTLENGDVQSAQFQTISEQKTFDEQSIRLDLQLANNAVIKSKSSGIITSSNCSPGNNAVSGGWQFSINDSKLVNLYTSIPLYRNLNLGDEGSDVQALQDELIHLKYLSYKTNIFDQTTIYALNLLFAKNGVLEIADSLDLTKILWIPQESAKIVSCNASMGDELALNSILFSLEPAISNISLSNIPISIIQGERVVKIGDTIFQLDKKGHLKIDDYSKIYSTSEYKAAMETSLSSANSNSAASGQNSGAKTISINGVYQLKNAVVSYAVSPGAIISGSADSNCLESNGKLYKIKLYSSSMGKTYFDFVDKQIQESKVNAPKIVNLNPDTSLICN
jgi:hypothetical protein